VFPSFTFSESVARGGVSSLTPPCLGFGRRVRVLAVFGFWRGAAASEVTQIVTKVLQA
jgi:hypothetical protein